jgi:UDP-N-acetylmuramate: L-alanyl-gamma-D-glutamyl-meso-diaminopimelate ligase
MPWTRVIRVGLGKEADVCLSGFEESPAGVRFRLEWRGAQWADVSWKLSGLYNARNAAMAATAAALAVNPDDPVSFRLDALARFRGVRRRQEMLHESESHTVYEDFGHHPTALAETLTALRARRPGTLLTAVFEPRSNTARTRVLQAGFVRALALADEVFLGAVNRAERLSAEERFDPEAVAQNLEAQGVDARAAASNELLLDDLVGRTSPAGKQSRTVVFFTNGSFDGIIGRYVASLRR